MTEHKPWQPHVDQEAEFNPFANAKAGKDTLINTPAIQDATEDTSPLQGTKDLSDEDSLEGVIADASDHTKD
jgi:hypothetical protein